MDCCTVNKTVIWKDDFDSTCYEVSYLLYWLVEQSISCLTNENALPLLERRPIRRDLYSRSLNTPKSSLSITLLKVNHIH